MSRSLAALTNWADAVAVDLQRTSMSWGGTALSDTDRATVIEALILCSVLLMDITSPHDWMTKKRDMSKWLRDVATIDMHALGCFLSDSVTLLRNVAEPTDLTWFKRQLKDEYPFVGLFIAPIRKELSAFLEAPSGRTFDVPNQFLSFLSHLTLVDINVDLVPDYVELEQTLRSYSPPESFVSKMNDVMREWLKDFSITEETFHPSHGDGATAELNRQSTYLDKYRLLFADELIDYVFSKHAGFDVRTFFPLPERHVRCNRTAAFQVVPKSLKTKRGISKEPTGLMYLEKGVAHSLDRFFQGHEFLRQHIDLHDQSLNGSLALYGSLTGQYATIDLSSASDMVSWDLVKRVFRGTPLLPFLFALRSRTVRLPGRGVMDMAKFAPMGSALCFPIETLIFACAVEVVVRRSIRLGGSDYPVWRVYGDDIIVHDDMYYDVVLALETLGFKPNASKSFAQPTRFRESCGVQAYDGIEVTPLLISRNFKSPPKRFTSCHAAQYLGIIDMANQCHNFDYNLTRSRLVKFLLDRSNVPPLFNGVGDGALVSPVPDNFRAKSRFNTNLFFSEIQVTVVRDVPAKPLTDEDQIDGFLCPVLSNTDGRIRLFETLRLLSLRGEPNDDPDPTYPLALEHGPSRSNLVVRWVPKPA